MEPTKRKKGELKAMWRDSFFEKGFTEHEWSVIWAYISHHAGDIPSWYRTAIRNEYVQFGRENQTTEKKEADKIIHRKSMKVWNASRTPEKKEADRLRNNAQRAILWANLTTEEKKAHNLRKKGTNSIWRGNRTEEKKEEDKEKGRIYTSKFNKTDRGREILEQHNLFRSIHYTPPQIHLNKPFDGCVGHHVDLHHLVFIPEPIHKTFRPHSPVKRFEGTETAKEARNLDILNSVAYAELYWYNHGEINRGELE